MFKNIVKNTLAQGFGKVATVFISVIITSILTRTLGKSGYGDYTFITAFVLLFGTIADWGTNIIAVREASSNKLFQPKIFGNITLIRFGFALVAFLLVNTAIRLNPAWESLVLSTTVASLVLFVLSLKTSFGVIFQTLLKFEYLSVIEIVSAIVFLLTIFLFSRNLMGVLAAWLISTMAAAALGYFFALKVTKFNWSFDLDLAKKIIKEAIPAGALFLVFTIYNRVDTVILQYYWGAGDVGVYGLAYKVHDNLVMGAAFLMNALFPLLSQKFSRSDNLEVVREFYQKSFDFMAGAAILVLVLVFIFSPAIVGILGGPEFKYSSGVLRVLIFGTFISYFNHLTGYSLIAFGRQRAALLIALAALFLNISGNLIFVPLYSYQASAIITIATEGIVLVLSSLVVARTLKFYPTLVSFVYTWATLIKKREIKF